MDVGKYQLDGTWISLTVDSDREFEPFEFKVQPIMEADYMAASKSPDGLTSLLIECVIGWNLTIGTDPLPCDDVNKRRYLPRFATYLVKAVNEVRPDEPTNLAGAIVGFAAKPDSFLKN
jgi:hypothetical protein